MKPRDVRILDHSWLLGLIGLILGLWLGLAHPIYAAPPAQDGAKDGYTLVAEGMTLYKQGDLPGALEKLLAALPLIKEAGNVRDEANTLGNIGAVYVALEQPKLALPYLEQTLALRRSLGDRRGEGVALGNLGAANQYLARYEQALSDYRQALVIVSSEGNQTDQASLLGAIGSVHQSLGQTPQALAYYDQALALQWETGNQRGAADTLSKIGSAHLATGQLEQALSDLEQALAIHIQLGDEGGQAFVLSKIGAVQAAQGQPKQALENYRQALALQRQVGGAIGQAVILGQIGAIYENLGQLQTALTQFEAALELQRQTGHRAGEGETLGAIGAVHQQLGRPELALDYFQQALAIAQTIGAPQAEGARLNSIGAVYAALGDPEQAHRYYQQALAIQQETGNRLEEAKTRNNIGASDINLGDYLQALDNFQKALALQRQLGDQRGEAATLVNIGTVLVAQGQPQAALGHFQQALGQFRQVGSRTGEATTLAHIGGIYQNFLGEYARALTNYQEALAIYQGIGARRGVAQQHNNVGYAYEYLNRPEQAAEQYQQALTVWREVKDRWGEATALDNLGGVSSRLEQPDQAAAYYEAALALRRAIGDRSGEATTLNNLGVLYHRDLVKPEQGLAYFQQALPLAREIGDVEGEAVILDNMGLAYLDLDQKEDALIYLRRSIERFDSIRSSMSIEEMKRGFADRYASHYRAIVPLLLELSLPEQAFEYAERARARAFLDQLGNVQIDPRQGADPALIEAEQRLVGEIASLGRRQRALSQQVANSQSREQLAEVQARLSAKRAEYAELLLQLKISNPAYAAMVSVDPLPLDQIQTEVVPEEATLVSFFVASDQTIAFVVGLDTFAAVPLAVTRRELAERVTTFRSLLALETENPTDRIVADRLAAARSLDDLLLAPLSPLLAGGNDPPPRSLIIVPHDVLHYLPFAALVDEADRPLSARFTMSLAPSGSALGYAQANDSPDNGRLLALGNPATDLPPLPYAGQEVTELTTLYPSPVILRGAAATETAFRTELAGVDWLHLAVHGQLEATSPLFSVLYLARGGPVGETSAAVADGRLEVHEILSLDLSGVNGVVLSACETGLGALSQGDELVGLTRAFLYAGAPVVVASLWLVHDEATAVLMTNFHQNLRDGLGPAAALQAAQEKVRQIPAWSAPFYWAGFQMIGAGGPTAEPRDGPNPIVLVSSQSFLSDSDVSRLVIGVIGLLALSGLVGWVIRGWRKRHHER